MAKIVFISSTTKEIFEELLKVIESDPHYRLWDQEEDYVLFRPVNNSKISLYLFTSGEIQIDLNDYSFGPDKLISNKEIISDMQKKFNSSNDKLGAIKTFLEDLYYLRAIFWEKEYKINGNSYISLNDNNLRLLRESFEKYGWIYNIFGGSKAIQAPLKDDVDKYYWYLNEELTQKLNLGVDVYLSDYVRK